MSSEREQPRGRRAGDIRPVQVPVDSAEPARGWRANPEPGRAPRSADAEMPTARPTAVPVPAGPVDASAVDATPAGFAEARREPRVALHAPVRIATIDPETDPESGKPFFRTSRELCSNVSRNGLFIRTSEPLEPGRRLLVELELPGGNEVEAVGRVAWVKRSLAPGGERGVGVELLGGNRLSTLHDFVATRDRRRTGDDPSSVG